MVKIIVIIRFAGLPNSLLYTPVYRLSAESPHAEMATMQSILTCTTTSKSTRHLRLLFGYDIIFVRRVVCQSDNRL